MKKGCILLLAILSLAGCKKKTSPDTTLTGTIQGLGTDTLYLYGMDEVRDRIDTIPVKDNKFAYTLTIDTLTPAYLLIRGEIEYPLYLDKGNRITIKGDTARLEALDIKGNSCNEEFTHFQRTIAGLDSLPLPDRERAVQEQVDSFVARHPSSLVGLYLLDKYFVQQPAPDFAHIKRLTEQMTGVLHDKLYMDRLNNDMAQQQRAEVGKYAPYFNLPNTKGEKINRTSEDFKQKNLLVSFWASWDDSLANATVNQELRALYRKYKKNKYFALLGISLDIDPQAWKGAIKRDTLSWEQACDFGGFNSEVAKQYAISRLPANFLISPEGQILARDLHGEALTTKIKEVVTAAEERAKHLERSRRKK
ncbi:MAG: AhpC/TSA family protein [Mediterranea sp.]|jgi:peroxiredoxin|nr:AhpC/TSA family protein [Mediterranea sp.]